MFEGYNSLCNCDGRTCPRCDAGFRVFYSEWLEEIKIWLKENNQIGANPRDYLDYRDAWDEYCELRTQDILDKEDVPAELYDLKNSWI